MKKMCFALNLKLCISHNTFETLWTILDPSLQDNEVQEHFFGPNELWLFSIPDDLKQSYPRVIPEFLVQKLGDLFHQEW